MYAEVLRLRVEVQSVFYSEHEDIHINEWRFPKKSLVLIPTGPAHRDTSVWNTRGGEYPLDEFWSDRFLVYPNDPRSGPERKAATTCGNNARHHQVRGEKDPGTSSFVSSGLANFYMPYGVGEPTCPGRLVARREIIVFCAKIMMEFDIEILTRERKFQMDSAYYGLGTQRPLRGIPFRMRRMKAEFLG